MDRNERLKRLKERAKLALDDTELVGYLEEIDALELEISQEVMAKGTYQERRAAECAAEIEKIKALIFECNQADQAVMDCLEAAAPQFLQGERLRFSVFRKYDVLRQKYGPDPTMHGSDPSLLSGFTPRAYLKYPPISVQRIAAYFSQVNFKASNQKNQGK